MKEGCSEAGNRPQMQWVYYYEMCSITWGLPSGTLLALPALSRAAAPVMAGVQSLVEALPSYISGSYPWLHIGTTWRSL